jgi:hypothetical protein
MRESPFSVFTSLAYPPVYFSGNGTASSAMESWRVKEYENTIGTEILEQMPSGVNTGWLAGGTEGIDSATD